MLPGRRARADTLFVRSERGGRQHPSGPDRARAETHSRQHPSGPDRARAETDSMCGLAGELRFDDAFADTPAVDRITGRLARRGPDGCGLWARGPVALGHRRLSIIDLSVAGSQPMVDSPLGLTVVFNGCIYNYKTLRAELEN